MSSRGTPWSGGPGAIAPVAPPLIRPWLDRLSSVNLLATSVDSNKVALSTLYPKKLTRLVLVLLDTCWYSFYGEKLPPLRFEVDLMFVKYVLFHCCTVFGHRGNKVELQHELRAAYITIACPKLLYFSF